MKVSINSLRGINERYGCTGDPTPDGVDALLARIGAQLGGIEEIVNIGAKYDGVIIAHVVSCENHPNADRLHVCMIDDGGVIKDVERNDKGLVQVVCGAPNVRAGVTVAWLPPGSTVPSTYDNEPFVLEARELRGVISNGMLASPKELGIGDSHEGIMLIDGDVQAGTMFADKYGLRDDVVIDIENKMFTHRPDCFGWLGVFREIAGIQDMPFKSPRWYRTDAEVPAPESEVLRLEVRNEVPERVPRYSVITMSDITIGPSPVWLQVELARVGVRPINNIVDLTNFFMLETGQPLHAYDYDKVRALDEHAEHATIVVRKPYSGEKLKLLNGKEIEPREEAVLIASASRAIGLGGVMGGADTEVDDTTKNIIIEAANFDMYSIRRTAMAHGIFSDAVTRFNKGQSPLQTLPVLAKMVDDVKKLGGRVAGDLIDDNHLADEVRERNAVHGDVTVSAAFVNARLGLELPAEVMARLLTNVECAVTVDADNLVVRAPFWRTDIEIPEDVVEEIGRLYGYDKLPLELPRRSLAPVRKDPMLELKARIRDYLSRAGASEVLSYSFVHGNLLDKAGQDRASAYKISNALSPELQYYRPSLTPSLLDKVHPNIKAGYEEFALFEIGKGHLRGHMDAAEPDVPMEIGSLGLVYASKSPQEGAAYFRAECYLNHLLDSFHVSGSMSVLPLTDASIKDDEWLKHVSAPYEPSRSAVLCDYDGNARGVVGEYRLPVRRALKLPDYGAGFEIDPALLLNGSAEPPYTPLPKYPKVTQDITLRVPADLAFQDIYESIMQAVIDQKTGHLVRVSPRDIYQSPDNTDTKQVTLRIEVSSYDRTLTDREVNGMLDAIASRLRGQLGSERV